MKEAAAQKNGDEKDEKKVAAVESDGDGFKPLPGEKVIVLDEHLQDGVLEEYFAQLRKEAQEEEQQGGAAGVKEKRKTIKVCLCVESRERVVYVCVCWYVCNFITFSHIYIHICIYTQTETFPVRVELQAQQE